VTQPAAAPAVTAPPPRFGAAQPATPSQANGQPQQLNGNAPAAYQPPQQQPAAQQQRQPSFAPMPLNAAPNNVAPGNATPQPSGPDTVTVDGVTYVNGQEPRALGSLSGPPPGSTDSAAPPDLPTRNVQTAPGSGSTRYYAPADRDGGAPLPNDVIILPNGQMAVPNR
jgi:hypothetical protein